MAKGDKKKMQKAVDTSVQESSDATNRALNENIIPTTNNMANYYNASANRQMQDYNDLMNQFKNYTANAPGPLTAERVQYNRPGEMNEAFGGYRNFMQTGGFSDQDLQNMRARGVSPIRANYQNMTNEMMRQKNLAGGYSPNMGAIMTKLGQQRGQMTSDALENVNARIAEQVQQGKMFGTQGMGGLSVQDAQLAQQAALANQQAGLEAGRINASYGDPKLQAMMAGAQLFGTNPGMAQTFGNQVLGGQQNWLQGSGQIGQIGRDRMQGQQMVAQTPSNFEVGMGRVGQGLQMGGQVAGAFMGLPGGVRAPMGGGINSGMYSAPNNIYSQNISGGGLIPSRRL